jgi:NAD+ diphosphatase
MCGFFAEAVSMDCATSDELEELRWFTVGQLVDAVREGEVLLSPSVSIAFRLLADWFKKYEGGDLEALVKEVRQQNGSA